MTVREFVRTWARPSLDDQARLVLGQIREVDPDVLQRVKKALTDFNARRRRWDCPRPANKRRAVAIERLGDHNNEPE